MVKLNGYFFGLNDQPKNQAFEHALDDAELYETQEECLKEAEEQRAKGEFRDDNATIQVYNFEMILKKA